MYKKWILTGASLLLVSMLAGCTADKAVSTLPQQTASTSPEPSMEAEDTSSSIPSFDIEGLNNGDVLSQDQIILQVHLNNFTLVDRDTKNSPNAHQGHIHYWLDSNPTDPGAAVQVDKDPGHIMLTDLTAGQHILTVKLVGTDHQPATETTTQIITFMVKRPNAEASTSESKPTPKPEQATATPAADGNAEATPTQAPEATPIATPSSNVNDADAKTASIAIGGLFNGDVVTTEDLKFQIDIRGLDLVDYKTNPDAKAGEGHIHIWLDTTSTEPKAAMKVYNDPKHIVIKHIAEGDHTLIVGLVGNDHVLIGARQAITFSVKHNE